jgi:hypothetical protein
MRGLAALLVAGGTKRVVFTDAAGRYRFDDLPARTYRINLDASRPNVATPRALPVVMARRETCTASIWWSRQGSHSESRHLQIRGSRSS